MATYLTDYKIIRAARRTDPPAFYKQGELYVVVQAAEIKEVRLSPEEQLECQVLAGQKRLPVETVINTRKLRKAGIQKYQALLDQGLLPQETGQVQETAGPRTLVPIVEEEDVLYEDDQDEDPFNNQQNNNMTDVPTATAQAIKLAKSDIDDIELRIANISLVPLELDEVTHFTSTVVQSERDLRDAFNTVYTLPHIEDAVVTDHITQQGTYHDKVRSVKLELSKLAAKLKPVPEQSPQGNTPYGPKRLALPKCELPKFAGHWKEWISFKDVINSTVLKLTDQATALSAQY